MAEEEAGTEEGQEGQESKKSKKKLIIIIAAAVLLIIVAAVAGVFFLGGGDEEGEEQDEPEATVQLAQVELERFIVNLAARSGYLRTTIMLEYDKTIIESSEIAETLAEAPEEDEPLPGLLAQRKAMIRDAMLTVMTSKRAEELLTAEGKEELKEELLDAANEAMGLDDTAITNVYFLEFIIQ